MANKLATRDSDRPDIDAFIALVRRAEQGDTKALGEVRAMLQEQPKLFDIKNADLARNARDAMLVLLTGKNELAKGLIERQMNRMEREVAGDAPTPLESLLAQRIVACWMAVQYAEIEYTGGIRKGMELEKGDYLAKQVDRASNRYLAAIRTLAQVRKLLQPTMQVNVARQQVNLANGPQVNLRADKGDT